MDKPKTLKQLKDEEHKVYQRFEEMMELNEFSIEEKQEFANNLNDYIDIQVEIDRAIQRTIKVGKEMAEQEEHYKSLHCQCGNQLKSDQELRDKICRECV